MDMRTVEQDVYFIAQKQDKYIRFGGKGILDGLKQRKAKVQYYKILGLRVTDGELDGLRLRAYRARYSTFLPTRNMDQEYELIDKKEFLTLPTYST